MVASFAWQQNKTTYLNSRLFFQLQNWCGLGDSFTTPGLFSYCLVGVSQLSWGQTLSTPWQIQPRSRYTKPPPLVKQVGRTIGDLPEKLGPRRTRCWRKFWQYVPSSGHNTWRMDRRMNGQMDGNATSITRVTVRTLSTMCNFFQPSNYINEVQIQLVHVQRHCWSCNIV